jgi:hypothetical protein
MAVVNIDALSDEVVARQAFEAQEPADARRRQLSAESATLVKADYRAAYNLLVGSNVGDRRGLVHKQFLREGTEGEICARHAMGRVLRRLANSPLDTELAAILILLAGHFDGKIGYRNDSNSGRPSAGLVVERRLRFENHLRADVRERFGRARVNNAVMRVRWMFQRLARWLRAALDDRASGPWLRS